MYTLHCFKWMKCAHCIKQGILWEIMYACPFGHACFLREIILDFYQKYVYDDTKVIIRS